jgi:1,4-dihydroxy-2-naphthoyl-CoA hydrolase
MSVWFRPYDLDELNRLGEQCMVEHLGIRITEIGADFLRGTLPVDRRTTQPMGLMHGGASVALAETLGSVASNCCVEHGRYYCVGQEINANHLRSVTSGIVTGTARPVHLGQRSHVWDIRIEDPRQRLVCVSRLTLAVLENRASTGSGAAQ